MSYFTLFPKQIYPVVFATSDNRQIELAKFSFRNFFRAIALMGPKINDGNYYYSKIRINDGERPDQLSYRLYKNPNYFWTFFIINDNLRLGEELQWPLSQKNLRQKIESDYEGKTLIFYKATYLKEIAPALPIVARNYVLGAYIINENVYGEISGANGKVHLIKPELGQIILKNYEGTFRVGEALIGETSNTRMIIDDTVNYADAPVSFIEPSTGREINNRNFIEPGDYIVDIASVTNRDRMIEINEKLSIIRALNPNSINEFAETFRRVIGTKIKN